MGDRHPHEAIIKEVTHDVLQRSVGSRVEVFAFGIAYRGRLTRFDSKSGTIKIVDPQKNVAVLEVERIEGFSKMGR